ncbi:hypothetical protein [Primorskyibacter sp. S87]|uniref:ATP-binding protein n=1 Tax=Primorskyibacter sp. S87 TaxID=3415126 RepID=UPI003C7AA9F3
MQAEEIQTGTGGNEDDAAPFVGQRKRKLELRFMPPKAVSLENLEDWRPFLEDPTLPSFSHEAAVAFEPEVAEAAEWIRHVLLVTRDLLLVGAVPCFDQIRLLNCTSRGDDRGTYDTLVEVPVFDRFSFNVFEAALAEAIRCVGFMRAYAPESQNREKLYDAIERDMMARITGDYLSNSSNLYALFAAYRRQIPFCHVGMGVYQIGWGAAARIINRSTTEQDSALSARLTKYKHVTAGRLRDAGLPAPAHRLVDNRQDALEAGEELGWPVVVKPSDLERGEGVHVDVERNDIGSAFDNAAALTPSNRALVERQVDGICHRLFVSGGALLYAVKRQPIGVYGDGTNSVAELVAIDCEKEDLKPRWRRSRIRPLDDLARQSLANAGLTEDTVPEKDQFVALRRIESTALGGTSEDVSEHVHPENLRVALAATKLCGLDIAGVDIITSDISQPWTETGAVINEVNFSPSLGSGEVSRSHLDEYIGRLVQDRGRIPVKVFVGNNEALEAARAYISASHDNGLTAVLTTATLTETAGGISRPLFAQGLQSRVKALVRSLDVEALAIVVQDDALFQEPLPLDSVDGVEIVNAAVSIAPGSDAQQLFDLLSAWSEQSRVAPAASQDQSE